MKGIQIKKFLLIVSSTVVIFCIIGFFVLWFFLKDINKSEHSQSITTQSNNSQNVSTDANYNGQIINNQNPDNQNINNSINTVSLNAKIKSQRYSLLSNGSWDKNKLNNFMNENINILIPNDCSIIRYKLADLNNDGFDEIGIMYEKIQNGSRYLTIGTLRWTGDQYVKDIETEFKENNYNIEATEIMAGDLISGGNSEFIFIQKGDGKTYSGRIKIAILFSKGFNDFYTQDTGYEIEVKDYDSDGKLELYTSEMIGQSLKHMYWSKWDGKKFYNYKHSEQTINVTEDDSGNMEE